MSDLIILIILIAFPLYIAVNGVRKKVRAPVSKSSFYRRDIISSVVLLFIFLLLDPGMFTPPDFSAMGKGILIPVVIYSAHYIPFLVPLIISLTRWNYYYTEEANAVFGYPVKFLPDNYREHLLFTLYIVNGVIFEELLCRQFMFRSFHHSLGLQGDALVIVSALLFSVGHLYQGWQGLLSSFLMGLFLGKIFLMEESILHTILLHLLLNLTIVVLAFRRIRKLKGAAEVPD
jgi:membrane protease YdiL (CAAX protease family)